MHARNVPNCKILSRPIRNTEATAAESVAAVLVRLYADYMQKEKHASTYASYKPCVLV